MTKIPCGPWLNIRWYVFLCAAALLWTVVLSGCPHSIGWSGGKERKEAAAETEMETLAPMSWAEMAAHMSANAEGGPFIYTLAGGDEESGPLWPLLGGVSCPREAVVEGNGKTVTLSERGSLLTVREGVTLTLRNITLAGLSANSASLVTVDGGTVRLEKGGIIRGNRIDVNSPLGGGVSVDAGSFYLAGGEIRSNVSPEGGGVAVKDGSFYMSGGEIRNNMGHYGGGLAALNGYSGGVFLTGGAVTNNSAVWNGAIFLDGMGIYEISGTASVRENAGYLSCGGLAIGSLSTLTMTGGSIRDNSASSGGGGVHIYSGGVFNMSGGSISGNTVGDHYAGNEFEGAGVALGETARFTMSGDAVVSEDNKVGGKREGIMIYVDGPLTANPAADIWLMPYYYTSSNINGHGPVISVSQQAGEAYNQFRVNGLPGKLDTSGYYLP
jgi:hypothetical protein